MSDSDQPAAFEPFQAFAALSPAEPQLPVQIGRYELLQELASGGMATVYVGRMAGAEGFARRVAIKRLHPQLARDPEFLQMFFNEARLAGRIQHANVVPIIDFATEGARPSWSWTLCWVGPCPS